MKRLGMLFLMGYLVSGGVAHAASYYVSKAGSDGNLCAQAQLLSTPRLTINAGIACLAGGDTLLVRTGNYDEFITSVPSGTSWSNKVRIANYPGEIVWLKPSTHNGGGSVIWLDGNFHYVEFDGINIDATVDPQNCVWTSTNNGNDPHHIRFQNAEMIAGAVMNGTGISFGAHALIGATGSNEAINLKIHGGGYPGLCGFACASYAVYIQGPNNLIDNCDFYDTSGAAVQIYGGPGDAADNNIVRNTRMHDIVRTGTPSEVWGILIQGLNNKIYNNIIYNINVTNASTTAGNAGIAVVPGYYNNKIWNNTIYNNDIGGIGIGSGTTGTEVKNNIAYANTGASFLDGGSGTAVSNNLFDVNPFFVNTGTYPLELTAGSPARNTGIRIAEVTTDAIGTPRPQQGISDIGAYEFRMSASAPTGLRINP